MHEPQSTDLSAAKVFKADLARIQRAGEALGRVRLASFSQQHVIHAALEALERELESMVSTSAAA